MADDRVVECGVAIIDAGLLHRVAEQHETRADRRDVCVRFLRGALETSVDRVAFSLTDAVRIALDATLLKVDVVLVVAAAGRGQRVAGRPLPSGFARARASARSAAGIGHTAACDGLPTCTGWPARTAHAALGHNH